MTTDIHIPPEAVAAAARALAIRRLDADVWDTHMDRNMKHFYIEDATAAIRAMLAAWPGMHTREWPRPWLGGMSGTDIILPLNTEPRDE